MVGLAFEQQRRREPNPVDQPGQRRTAAIQAAPLLVPATVSSQATGVFMGARMSLPYMIALSVLISGRGYRFGPDSIEIERRDIG